MDEGVGGWELDACYPGCLWALLQECASMGLEINQGGVLLPIVTLRS